MTLDRHHIFFFAKHTVNVRLDSNEQFCQYTEPDLKNTVLLKVECISFSVFFTLLISHKNIEV